MPSVTFRGIKPDTTFQYRFLVRRSGTYWFHSHAGMQKQVGVYGPLVVHTCEPDPVQFDRDYVVMLSDWSVVEPHHVMTRLKKSADYYHYQRRTLQDVLIPSNGVSRRAALPGYA